jgi:type II secretory pathway pseudopilin PulG
VSNREIQFFLTLRDEATKKWQQFQQQVGSGAKNIEAAMQNIGRIIAGVFSVMAIKSFVAASNEAEQAQVALSAVLASTQHAAGMTQGELVNLAKSLESVTRFEEDTIVSGEAMLLSFTDIGKNIIPQATEAALNLAEKFHLDVPQAAKILGKALEDPAQGMMTLKKVGIILDDSQKDSIKTFIRMGDTVSAQKVILDALGTAVGGLAREMGESGAGKIAQFENSIKHLKEAFGDIVKGIMVAVMPTLKAVIDAIQSAPVPIQTMILVVGGLTTAIIVLNSALITNPITWVIIGIAAAVVGLTAAFGPNKKAIEDEKEAMEQAKIAADKYQISLTEMTKAQRVVEIQALNTAITLQIGFIADLAREYYRLGENSLTDLHRRKDLKIAIQDAIKVLAEERQHLKDVQDATKAVSDTQIQAYKSQKEYDDNIKNLEEDLKNLSIGSEEYIAKLAEVIKKKRELKTIEDSAKAAALEKLDPIPPLIKYNDNLNKNISQLKGVITAHQNLEKELKAVPAMIVKIDDSSQKMFSDMIKGAEGYSSTLDVLQNSMVTGFQAAFSGAAGAGKTFIKSLLTGFIDMIQGMIFAAEAASLAKAVTSWGVTLISDLPWLAAATAALQEARAIVNRFHEGGEMGYGGHRISLASDERPAVLKVGETVRTKEQEANIQRGGGNIFHFHFPGIVTNEEGVVAVMKRALEQSGFNSLTDLITNDRKGYSFGIV